MKAVGVFVAIALALALQTTLARFLVGGIAALDLVLVVVVYVALTTGPVSGMLAGSAAGIIQDALSSGLIGVGGLAKSIVGFCAGVVGQQFIVTAALPRFLMFLGATAVHSGISMGLYVLLGLRSFPSPWAAVVSQALGNAAVGMIAFTIIEAVPGVIERRRMRRRL
ncbi:MAG: rod shape-determining protein MreD [Acidimicrobiia bacterium]|nr:rod shape-determining protein MreD [Acidimicrobiia bacterium]